MCGKLVGGLPYICVVIDDLTKLDLQGLCVYAVLILSYMHMNGKDADDDRACIL